MRITRPGWLRKPRWLTNHNVAIFAAFFGLGNAAGAVIVTWLVPLHYSRADMTMVWAAIMLWITTSTIYMFRAWKFQRLFDESMQLNEQQRTLLRKVTGR